MRVPELRFDQLYRYNDLTAVLEALATEHPKLMTIESIGKSLEGRPIWLCTVTNEATGPHSEKPALFIEANIHAAEVTSSTAALHLLHRLCSEYGTDKKITAALDTRCFYVVPRVNPDGVELALAERPRFVRSSTRPWPRGGDHDGLVHDDIDGDGRILAMRISDPHGPWKTSAEDSRLLVAREPDVEGPGPYYRLLPEGTIRNYDGVLVPVAPARETLDLNRQFPMEWRGENEQPGAGPYPLSEPETRALAEAVDRRPNICAYIAYHTFGGLHLRPYATHPDDALPTEDLRAYEDIGKLATAITGYPALSVYRDFRRDPNVVATGGSDDWAYEHLGVFSWTTELWNPLARAGITECNIFDWLRSHPVEDDLALLRWSDETVGRGNGFVDWYAFDHPQLGAVELGGWDVFHLWLNPPASIMEQEIAPQADVAVMHLLISPRLALHSASAERIAEGTWQVRVVIQNTGWLPTNVTQKALERRAVDPLEAEIFLPDGATLVGGKARVELDQLTGRSTKRSAWHCSDPTTDWTKAEWTVCAPSGGAIHVEARHPRAGTIRADIPLADLNLGRGRPS